MTAPDQMSGNVWKVFVNTGIAKPFLLLERVIIRDVEHN